MPRTSLHDHGEEPALEFVLLHIYYYIFSSDFWAKGEGCTVRPIKSDRMAVCAAQRADALKKEESATCSVLRAGGVGGHTP